MSLVLVHILFRNDPKCLFGDKKNYSIVCAKKNIKHTSVEGKMIFKVVGKKNELCIDNAQYGA